MVKIQSKTTGTMVLLLVIFLIIGTTFATFQWINGSTASAKTGGEFFTMIGVLSLLVILIILRLDKLWRWV